MLVNVDTRCSSLHALSSEGRVDGAGYSVSPEHDLKGAMGGGKRKRGGRLALLWQEALSPSRQCPVPSMKWRSLIAHLITQNVAR